MQFSTEVFSEQQLVPKEVTPEQQAYFKKGIAETYDSYKLRQQQQQQQ
ncbi:MAG: hypothetical protein ACKOC0_08090 [Cytophagales bacterium]